MQKSLRITIPLQDMLSNSQMLFGTEKMQLMHKKKHKWKW